MKLSRIIARYLILSSNSHTSTYSETSLEENIPIHSENTDLSISPLFVQFIRTFLCQCPKKSIRDSAAHILFAIFNCVSREAQSHILSLISLLWSELSTYVPYSNQFVQLSIHLLNSYPTWSGRAQLIEQVIWILMQRLEALKRHPNRTLYTALMHFTHSQKGLLPGVSIPCDSSTKSGSSDESIDDITCLQSTHNDSSTRTWASVAAHKPGSSHAPPTGNSGGPNETTDADQTGSTDLSRNLSVLPTPFSLSSSAFTFELEPCLLCHAKVIDEPFYVVFRWDSEPNVPRRSLQSVVSTIYNSRFTQQFRQSPSRMSMAQNSLRGTPQQSNLSTSGVDIQFTSNTSHTSTTPNASGVIQTTLNTPKPSTTPVNTTATTSATTTKTTTINTTANGGGGGRSVGGSATSSNNAFSLIVPVQLKSRASSSVHIFDLESSYLISQITVKVCPKEVVSFLLFFFMLY
ncbi:unnamed protein product [Trichobilharzia regenti]|nr:unnamed protein product [Trichobilharzia regenti]